MLDFKEFNDKEREFYNKDFSAINELLKRIRFSLTSGNRLKIDGLDLSGIVDYKKDETLTYITLFQSGLKFIRYGSRKSNFEDTLNRNIEMLRKNKDFAKFNVDDEDVCRIMLEYVIDRKKIKPSELNSEYFNNGRFEIGINGLELRNDGISYYYMPTDAIVLNQLALKAVLNTLVKKTPIGKMTNSISQRLKILSSSKTYEYFLFRSRAFISYKDTCIPLYRGNILYNNFNHEVLYNQVVKSSQWLLDNMYEDGRFLYYYDCTDDSKKDHEHPKRDEDNLYYNDLRHCGGIIALIRAYQLTSDEKYVVAAKKAIDWSISITKEHDTKWGKAYYAFYNNKAKLGGSGVLLVALMQYRNFTGDKSYDEYIKGYVRHILSRVYKNGELLGYYIHPAYQDGNPLVNMSDEERKETFSFYYPGEALLGLALFEDHFYDDDKLVKETRKISKKALDWIVDERPKIYADLFTALPSDAWLMQAIEEWAKDKDFRKNNYINFVFTDANTMLEKMYQRDDSPYIDYEGGYYYNYGDHYFPDGARSEGLVAAYYLAKFLGKDNIAKRLLDGCKKAAKSQFYLFNCSEYTYSHKNQARSLNSIRFKATRQWVRVDSIQHVACFFARLYKAEN